MSELQSPDREDADWKRYPDTVLWFSARPELRIDLRIPLSVADRAALARIGFTSELAVVTAFDPFGCDLALEENDLRAAKLEARLKELGHAFVRVAARSPDGSHSETSVAARMRKGDAVELAREFGQVAIFWYDGDRFWIVGVRATIEPIALPDAP